MHNNINNRSSQHESAKKRFPDQGPLPYADNIKKETLTNPFFRRTLWTGINLQLTLMNIPVHQDIGWKKHDHVDQFLYIEQGQSMVIMGKDKEQPDYEKDICDGGGIFVPAGTWHNVINIGGGNLKLFSVYSPPEHPKGTIHPQKTDADIE